MQSGDLTAQSLIACGNCIWSGLTNLVTSHFKGPSKDRDDTLYQQTLIHVSVLQEFFNYSYQKLNDFAPPPPPKKNLCINVMFSVWILTCLGLLGLGMRSAGRGLGLHKWFTQQWLVPDRLGLRGLYDDLLGHLCTLIKHKQVSHGK